MSSRDPQAPTYFPACPVNRAISKPHVNQLIKGLRSDHHCTAPQLSPFSMEFTLTSTLKTVLLTLLSANIQL